jgi:hypothetical protein
MRFSVVHRGNLTAAAMILAGAAVVVGALTPALSDEVRPLLQSMGIISCTGMAPCEEGKNSGHGPGLEGVSLKGNGVVGTTSNSVVSSSQFGVFGWDKTTVNGVQNAGVEGVSTTGFGLFGFSTNGTGVQGNSSNGIGVVGNSPNAPGVFGTSVNSPGVSGVSSVDAGVEGFSTSASGVVAFSNTGDALQATTNSGSGTAVIAQSFGGIGVSASGGGIVGPLFLPAVSVIADSTSTDLIYGCAPSRNAACVFGGGLPQPQFVAGVNGNVFITGLLFTAGFCSSGCASTKTKGEQRVRLFTAQQSLPTVEDFGEAQLVGGQSSVRIDPAFARTTDGTATYLVFITPEGNSNGLYVLNKTVGGFDVRENNSGRSTIAFSYRIVAKPFREHPARLQMITVTKPGVSLPATSRMQ